jgi:hypothetical protein
MMKCNMPRIKAAPNSPFVVSNIFAEATHAISHLSPEPRAEQSPIKVSLRAPPALGYNIHHFKQSSVTAAEMYSSEVKIDGNLG